MKIWKHGTKVKLNHGHEGIITTVRIIDTLVEYTINYYDGKYCCDIFHEFEFSVEEGEKEEIGFR